MEKVKYNYTQMIQHMQEKGIQFNICSIADAKDMLTKRNYYFKLTVYRKCFSKIDGQYSNLDFAYLTDLASIDASLRYYILDLSLDIEHSLKTALDDLITQNPNEDGYSIVQEFRNYDQFGYDQMMRYLQNNKYLRDMFNKHHQRPAIWVLLEVMTFATLSKFIEFYSSKYQARRLNDAKNLLRYAKNLRNASAHSNPLLVNIFSEKEHLRYPNTNVVRIARQMGLTRQDVMDQKINDLVSIMYLHKKYTSNASHEHIKRSGKRLIQRMKRHPDYYKNNQLLNKSFDIFNILVDF